jgi:hypothetical protein
MSFNEWQYIKKIDRVDWVQVDRVPGRPSFPGPIPKWVFASTQTGPRPGSTRRAGPGFKTLVDPYRGDAYLQWGSISFDLEV